MLPVLNNVQTCSAAANKPGGSFVRLFFDILCVDIDLTIPDCFVLVRGVDVGSDDRVGMIVLPLSSPCCFYRLDLCVALMCTA